MNALAQNQYTEGWANIGKTIPRPQAILAISAHWYVPATAVTANEQPRTIHDFGGFPVELYQIQYPAPGDLKLAGRMQEILAPQPVAMDVTWGLDHGTWAVLCHVFPQADIPIVQLSIDHRQPPQFHFELGKQLAALRDEGVLIIGSGNLVHNLRAYAWGNPTTAAYDWATRFDAMARELMIQGQDERLIDYPQLGQDAMLSIPTPEHYLPLLYVLGCRQEGEAISFPVEGYEGGSISMLTVQVG